MNIRPVGAVFPHADRKKERQTDMTKLIDPFRNLVNVPKNGTESLAGTTEQDVK
jgi:hypothetical protein